MWGDTIPLLVSFARFLTLRFSSKSPNVCCACMRIFCSFSSTDRTFALQFLHKCLGRPSSSVTESCSSSLARLGQSSFKLDDEKKRERMLRVHLRQANMARESARARYSHLSPLVRRLHKIICASYTRLRMLLSVNPAHAHTVVPRLSFPPPH